MKKLIDLDMTNNELMEKAKVSKSTFYKMKNGQNVTTDVLLRICNASDYDMDEIVEINDIKEEK
ncbi:MULTISPECIES: helix-turn-helix transcriptional regulator [Leptotrichia]|nr:MULTISPECIES: helix-turn-helix transcriptional regulator [Leptotrichia]